MDKNLIVVSDYGTGKPAFAPGSSGYDDKFMEIILRGGSAWKLCGEPKTEAKFSIDEV